jgi:hypothetical protein
MKNVKEAKVDFSFGFNDEELNLMYMHFNGMKFNRFIDRRNYEKTY